MGDEEAATSTSTRETYLKVYELYVQRAIQEGNWYWSRFRIYLSLNAGIFVAVGFLVKEDLVDVPKMPGRTVIVMIAVSLVGAYLSKAWESVAVDGAHWQDVIHEHLAAIENKLETEGVNLFSDIREKGEADPSRDVVEISRSVARFFKILWIALVIAGVAIALRSASG